MKFYSWERPAIFDRQIVDGRTADGRLLGELTLQLTETADSGEIYQADGLTEFAIMSARDVQGINERVIIRTAPQNNARGAETTKMVHVDFRVIDLLWRYTPRPTPANKDNGLPPWMVVLVGTEDEMQYERENNIIRPDDAVYTAHPLSESHRWAHIHEENGTQVARLLSPRPLEPLTAYRACIVPCFNEDGNFAWDNQNRPDVLPVYYQWRFWTAEAGDFETLVGQLFVERGGNYGKSVTTYERGNLKWQGTIRGAIASLDSSDALEPDAAATLQGVKQDLDTLNTDLNALDPRRDVIGLPLYGRPWKAEPQDTTTWGEQLNNDPRHRGVAGIGTWLGAEAQDKLVQVVRNSMGAVEIATQRVNSLAFGQLAAERLWTNRVPQTTENQLRIFGIIMNRIPVRTPDGKRGTLMSIAGGDNRSLSGDALSSAVSRMLRPSGAIARFAADGATAPQNVAQSVNQCEPLQPAADPDIPHVDRALDKRGLSTADAHRNLRFDGSFTGDEQPTSLAIGDELDQLARKFVEAAGDVSEDDLMALAKRAAEIIAKKTGGNPEKLIETIFNALVAEMQREGQLSYEFLIGLFASLLAAGAAGQKIPDDVRALIEELVEAGADAETIAKELATRLGDELGDDPESIFETLLRLREKEEIEEPTANDWFRWVSMVYGKTSNENGDTPEEDDTSDGLIAVGDFKIDASALEEHLIGYLEPAPEDDCEPTDIETLGTIVTTAVNPNNGLVRERVLDTLHGIDSEDPVRVCVGINHPTWTILKQYAKEWLLPGVGQMPKHAVIAMQSNPTFVDAYLTGLNTQLMNELNWRNVPIDPNCMPLRGFWAYLNVQTGEREADIKAIQHWTDNSALGSPDHQHRAGKSAVNDDPTDAGGGDLILVFNTPLFRRYPQTLVYLAKLSLDSDGMAGDVSEQTHILNQVPDFNSDDYVLPIFQGNIQDDIVFFAFDVDPETLDDYWLVLEEPPSELRFRVPDGSETIAPDNSARFAIETMDMQTRVGISGLYLEWKGEN